MACWGNLLEKTQPQYQPGRKELYSGILKNVKIPICYPVIRNLTVWHHF